MSKDKKDRTLNRRDFLRKTFFTGLAGTAMAIFGGILLDVWQSAARFTPARWVEVGPLDFFLTESTTPFPDKKVAVIKRRNHLAAISLECTHLGCLVHTYGEGFYCPCHGSEFGPAGEVYSGPATQPLLWHPLRVRRNHLWVHSGKTTAEPQWIELHA